MRFLKGIGLGLMLIGILSSAQAQTPATAQLIKQSLFTYPVSDPDPMPVLSTTYPWAFYASYSDVGSPKEWQMIELENAYLKLQILPELGGRLFTAIEKASGKPFIYQNDVLKFRNMTAQGMWFPGGIEVQSGQSDEKMWSPQNTTYHFRTEADGSAVCTLSGWDIWTRASWRLVIRLPKNQASFSTQLFWFNAMPWAQAFRPWINTTLSTKNNPTLWMDGLGHQKLPEVSGRFAQGALTKAWAVYAPENEIGVGQVLPEAQSVRFSTAGRAFGKALTESAGTYFEVQTGQQEAWMPPYAGTSQRMIWFPMKGLKAISAANEQVALHVQQENDANVLVEISPLIAQTTTVQVQVGTDVRAKQTMQFKPLQTVSIRAPHTATEPLTILVGNHVVYRSNAAQAEANPTTAFTSAQTALQQRDLAQAKARYEATLAQNPNDAAALIGLGALYVQLHNGYEAVNVLTRARAQNPSSAEAAYCYGLAQREWGTTAEAQEAFKTALDSAEWQVPAALQLAELAIAAKQYAAALTYVQKGLAQQPSHALLLATKAVIHRLKGQTALAQTAVTGLLKTDPLNTIALVEQWILSKNTTKKQALTQNLLTTDAFMEVALWYARMGRTEDASALLNVYDEQVKRHKVAAHPEPYFWLGEWAFVQPTAAMKPYDRAKAWYQKAVGMSAEGITFFRPESAGVLHRAYEILPHWKTALYWAQLRAHALDPQLALQLLDDQADRPDFAPFYAFRASLREATRPQDAQTDLERAAQLAPSEWRYGVLLNQFFRRQNKPAKALDVIRTYLQRFPGKEMVGIEFAKTAYEQNEFALCADVLRDQFITPSSQNTDAQRYWRDCNLRMAFNGIKARQYAPAMEATKAAMSRPARLGTPPADQDLRLVEFTEALVWEGLGKPEKAAEGFQKVANFSPNNEFTPADGLTALALESLRRPQDAIRGVRAALARNPQNPFARWTDLYFKNAQDDPTPEMMTNREFVMTLKLLESLAK